MTDDEEYRPHIFERLTVRRVQILKLLADGRTETEIARELQIEPTTAHSSIDELRDLSGQPSGRDLGRWWRDVRRDYVWWMAQKAGSDLPPDDP